MKKTMSREHADLLKRYYMSMGFNHDLMSGIQSCKAQAYDLLANIHTQTNVSGTHSNCNNSHQHYCSRTNS